MNLKFLTSAVNLQGCPTDDAPEVVLLGRSNAGKSSLINGIAQSRVAKTSSTPGKTRLLNFYESRDYRFVDMPGYGFSVRTGEEQVSWQKMIEPYLASRGNLCGLLVIMDIRRNWTRDEAMILKWLSPRGLPAAVVLTKADKLSRGAGLDRAREIRQQSGLEHVLLTTALSTGRRDGCDELADFIYTGMVEPVLKGAKGRP